MWPVQCVTAWSLYVGAGIISFLLLGIEEIGVQIEEPFGILPMCAPTLSGLFLRTLSGLDLGASKCSSDCKAPVRSTCSVLAESRVQTTSLSRDVLAAEASVTFVSAVTSMHPKASSQLWQEGDCPAFDSGLTMFL